MTIRQTSGSVATFTAPAINCGGCANRVRAALANHPGVRNVDVAVPTKRVAVAFDEAATSADAIARALTEAGYPPARAGT